MAYRLQYREDMNTTKQTETTRCERKNSNTLNSNAVAQELARVYASAMFCAAGVNFSNSMLRDALLDCASSMSLHNEVTNA